MRPFSLRRTALVAVIPILAFFRSSILYCQPESFTVRAGVGTDINLGLGIGGGAAYAWNVSDGGTSLEFGVDFYSNHTTDKYEREDGNVTGEDKTTLAIFGIRANALLNYYPSRRKVYFILGAGFVVAKLTWEENENAPNWLRPYHDEAEGTSAGNIINLGIGVPLTANLDVRFETPILFLYSSAGKSATVAPTATLGLSYRFN